MNAIKTGQWLCRWTRHAFSTATAESIVASVDMNQELRSRLKQELMASMRNKDKMRSAVVKSILSDITYAEKTNATRLDIAALMQSSITRRQDAMQQYEAAQRPELAKIEQDEISIIAELLPKQMTRDEIQAIVTRLGQQHGFTSQKDMGKLMKLLNEQLNSAVAPKKLIADVVKSYLTPK